MDPTRYRAMLMRSKWITFAAITTVVTVLLGVLLFKRLHLEFIDIFSIERDSLVDESTAIVQAAWVQAGGSIFAILAAVGVAIWGEWSRRRDRLADAEARQILESRRSFIYKHNLITQLEKLAATANDYYASMKKSLAVDRVDLTDAVVGNRDAVALRSFSNNYNMSHAFLFSDEERAHILSDKSLARLQSVWRKCQQYDQLYAELYLCSDDEELYEKIRITGISLLSLLLWLTDGPLHASTSIRKDLEDNS